MAVFKTTYRVSWSDTDAAKVVHHSNYFRFFERAEEEFYRVLGLGIYDLVEQGKFWLPRVEVFCSYKAPSRFGDVLEVSLSIEEIKEKTVKYGFSVSKEEGDIIVAEGYVVAVNANKKTGKAISIPSGIAEKLKAFKNS